MHAHLIFPKDLSSSYLLCQNHSQTVCCERIKKKMGFAQVRHISVKMGSLKFRIWETEKCIYRITLCDP